MLTAERASQIITEQDTKKRDDMVDELADDEAKEFVKFLLELVVRR